MARLIGLALAVATVPLMPIGVIAMAVAARAATRLAQHAVRWSTWRQ